jgi:hypothetical protein
LKFEPQQSPPSTPIKREHGGPTHKKLEPQAAAAKVKVERHASSLSQSLIFKGRGEQTQIVKNIYFIIFQFQHKSIEIMNKDD